MKQKSILFVATSHDRMGSSTRKTGLWLEEFAIPYLKISESGFHIVTASPKGGPIPLDPESVTSKTAGKTSRIFLKQHPDILENSLPLDSVSASDYLAVFYPGGHGPLWDLANNQINAALAEDFFKSGKIIAAVCHGPAALISAQSPNGKSILSGRKITGFSNAEEKIVALDRTVPFSLEDRLKASGAIYSCSVPWTEYVLTDGELVTGQNPQSSGGVAEGLLSLLRKK